MSKNKQLETHLVTSFEAFRSLKHDWDSLYNQSQKSTIFSSWDWMFTWWEVFHDKSQRELFIICLYQDSELVGIAPFQIGRGFPLSLLQGKTLRFIGSSSKNEIMTEFSDFIVKDGYEKQLVTAVENCLIKNRKHWDFADLEFLQKDALVLQCFDQSEKKIFSQKIQYGVRYLVPKMASSEDYQNHIKSRWSKMFKRKNRSLERDGESVVEGIGGIDNIKPAFDQLADMHQQRWQGKLKNNIFDTPEFSEFHLKILERLVPKKKANILTLKLDDDALASCYLFEDKGQVHYYQSGFYTENANRYSPLFLLICKQIGHVSRRNKIFDFMFDDNSASYKKEQYGAQQKQMYRLKLSTTQYRLSLIKSIKNLNHLGRNIKGQLKNSYALISNKLSSVLQLS